MTGPLYHPSFPVMRFSLLLALFTLFMPAQLHVAGADKVLLLPRWEAGKIYRQQTDTELRMAPLGDAAPLVQSPPAKGAAAKGAAPAPAGEVPQQHTTITQQTEIAVSLETGTANKLALVKSRRVKASVRMDGQTLAYDSEDPAKSPPFLQQAFGALLRRAFTLVYDRDDKFLDVRGTEPGDGTPLGTTKGPDARQLAEAFRKSQDLALPKSPVAPGDTWTFEEKVDLPPVGTFAFKARGRYDSVVEVDGRKHARVLLDGIVENSAAAPQLVQIGPGSKFSGEILFDLDRRVVANSTTSTELKLTIGGQDAPISETTTTKLVQVEAAR